jgi:hypothetical protein
MQRRARLDQVDACSHLQLRQGRRSFSSDFVNAISTYDRHAYPNDNNNLDCQSSDDVSSGGHDQTPRGRLFWLNNGLCPRVQSGQAGEAAGVPCSRKSIRLSIDSHKACFYTLSQLDVALLTSARCQANPFRIRNFCYCFSSCTRRGGVIATLRFETSRPERSASTSGSAHKAELGITSMRLCMYKQPSCRDSR